jgi:hypothetical protein
LLNWLCDSLRDLLIACIKDVPQGKSYDVRSPRHMLAATDAY